MSNPLFQALGGQNNPLNMLNELRTNPVQFAIRRGFNLPQNISADPNSIIQYLLTSGQISQDRYNQAVQMAQNFKQF